MSSAETPIAVPRLAATVVLLRESAGRVEVFLMKRSGLSDVLGLAHVFPGGKVDPSDGEGEAALVAAAVRETREEAGVDIPPTSLVVWARWITPEVLPRRFDATFFLARLPEGAVARHDGRELTHSDWLTPEEAVAMSERDEILLPPPTYLTLCSLMNFSSIDEMFACARSRQPPAIQPVGVDIDCVRHLAMPGDPRHGVADHLLPGPTLFRWNGARFVPDEST